MSDEVPASCEFDENGDFVYQLTSPAQTPGSKAFGSPMKGGEPWTSKQDHARGSYSAHKPSQSRQHQRTKKPKKSFFDTDSIDGLDDNDRSDDTQLPRNAAILLPAPLDDVENLDKSSPARAPIPNDSNIGESFPMPLRNSQNAVLATGNDEDQDPMSDADKSPTPKPRKLVSLRQRRMSGDSDEPGPSEPAPPKPRKVAPSRRREMSDASTIDEHPKKKGIMTFSSGPPSVTENIEEESLEKIRSKMRAKSSTASQTEKQAKAPTDRRKSFHKLKSKVKLSALDLEGDEEVDEQSDDPFDQANIPPSRGVSPGPSKRKGEEATKKQPIKKSSKTTPPTKRPSTRHKKAGSKSAKPSPQEKPSAKPRQKAKTSAAEVLQPLAPSGSSKDDGNDGCLSDNLNSLFANGLEAAAGSSEAPALTKKPKATRDLSSVPHKDVVYISSASESEDFNVEISDDDEYVDESGSKPMQGIEQRTTRNGTTRSKAQSGLDTMSKQSRGTRKRKTSDVGDGGVDAGLVLKHLPKKSTKTSMAQLRVPKEELLATLYSKQQKSTAKMAQSPAPKKATTNRQRQSAPEDQGSADETEDRSSTDKSAPLQVEQAETSKQLQIMPQATGGDRTDSVAAATMPAEPQSQRSRDIRQPRANHSQSKPGPSDSKAIQSQKQAKSSRSVVAPSPKLAHDDREQRIVGAKNKERQADSVVFGAGGPKNNGKSRNNPRAAGLESQLEDSSTGPDSNTTKAVKTEPNSSGHNDRFHRGIQDKFTSASSSEVPVAQPSRTQLPSSQADNRAPAVDSTIELSESLGKGRGLGSHVSLNHTKVVIGKHSKIIQGAREDIDPPRNQVPNDKRTTKTQKNTWGGIPQGNMYDDADDTTDLQFGDDFIHGFDELLVPDSLEQPCDIDYSASASQLRDADMISRLVDQGLRGGDISRKGPLPDECPSQGILPVNEQYSSQTLVKNRKSAFRQQLEQQQPTIHQSHLAVFDQQLMIDPEHVVPNDQPAIHQQRSKDQQFAISQHPITIAQPIMTAKQQRTERQPRMNQQPVMSKYSMNDEKKESNRQTTGLQASPAQEAAENQQPMSKRFLQGGNSKDSAKIRLKSTSMNFQRPSKRAKRDVSEPNAEQSPLMSSNYFCVPANGLSSDDVFAPKRFNEDVEIDYGVLEQLRGIEPTKNTATPETESKIPMVSQFEKVNELPRQRLSTQGPAKASHLRPMQQRFSPGSFVDKSSDQTSGSNLWRQSMMNRRAQGCLSKMERKEQEVIEEPDTYEGVENVMHRIVAVSFFIARLNSYCH